MSRAPAFDHDLKHGTLLLGVLEGKNRRVNERLMERAYFEAFAALSPGGMPSTKGPGARVFKMTGSRRPGAAAPSLILSFCFFSENIIPNG